MSLDLDLDMAPGMNFLPIEPVQPVEQALRTKIRVHQRRWWSGISVRSARETCQRKLPNDLHSSESAKIIVAAKCSVGSEN